MSEKISDYITFPKTFENYKWYKPILVFIVAAVLTLVFTGILLGIFYVISGPDFVNIIMSGGYEVLNTEMGQIFSDLAIIMMLLALFLAAKIVKDRPFSSYSSSRGGWNYRLYFKALVIPLIMYAIFEILTYDGVKGTYHFSIPFLIITLIMVPIQCITEEYVYRGLIMQTVGSWFNIPIVAIIIQAIIFAISHGYNAIGIIEIGVFGLIAGFLTWKTNGIEVSSAFHTANNLILALLVMFGIQSTTSSPTLNDVVLAIVFEVILLAVMYFIGMKTNWFGEIETEN